jgi:hypothetical protein
MTSGTLRRPAGATSGLILPDPKLVIGLRCGRLGWMTI